MGLVRIQEVVKHLALLHQEKGAQAQVVGYQPRVRIVVRKPSLINQQLLAVRVFRLSLTINLNARIYKITSLMKFMLWNSSMIYLYT